MKDQRAGMPFLISLCNKIGSMCHPISSKHKYKRLDAKLREKVLQVKDVPERRHEFKTINSIIMKFPEFKEGLKNIKVVFQKYDEDSDGVIDREELNKCSDDLELHLSEADFEDLFHSCDIDGSQGIQFNEFIVLLCLVYLLKEASPTKSTESIGSPAVESTFDTIIEAFLFFDKNGDGKLRKKDMFKAMNEASPWERSPGHVSANRFSIFEEMDWSRRGKVSFREFLFAFIDWVGVEMGDETTPVKTVMPDGDMAFH